MKNKNLTPKMGISSKILNNGSNKKKLNIQNTPTPNQKIYNTQNLKQPSQNQHKLSLKPFVKDNTVRIHPGDNKTNCFFVTNNYKEPELFKPMFRDCNTQRVESLVPTLNKIVKPVNVRAYQNVRNIREDFVPYRLRYERLEDENII